MCLLLETIKILDGKPVNPAYHNQRFNQAREELYNAAPIFLENEITVPDFAQQGIFKCRVIYREKIEKIEFIPHCPRKIESFQLVRDDTVEYSYKYTDRTQLQKLFEQRNNSDEIIIIKNGLVTDSYTGNLVFFDGSNWFTPNQPLLKGTQRQFLLDSKQIFEATIREKDIDKYQSVGMINVFYSLENMPIVKNIAISRNS